MRPAVYERDDRAEARRAVQELAEEKVDRWSRSGWHDSADGEEAAAAGVSRDHRRSAQAQSPGLADISGSARGEGAAARRARRVRARRLARRDVDDEFIALIKELRTSSSFRTCPTAASPRIDSWLADACRAKRSTRTERGEATARAGKQTSDCSAYRRATSRGSSAAGGASRSARTRRVLAGRRTRNWRTWSRPA